MKTLTYTRAHNLGQLHDQIMAGVPALAGTYARPGDGAQEPKLRAESVGDAIRLTVPDDADEGAIAAVVAAHVPAPPPPGVTSDDFDFLDEIRANIDPGADTWGAELLAWTEAQSAMLRIRLGV